MEVAVPSREMVQQGVERREEMLSFIRNHIESKGYAPTIKEIADEVGPKSSNVVRGHLRRLEDEGRIRMTPNTARSIVVLD